jgi:hypothetical protein
VHTFTCTSTSKRFCKCTDRDMSTVLALAIMWGDERLQSAADLIYVGGSENRLPRRLWPRPTAVGVEDNVFCIWRHSTLVDGAGSSRGNHLCQVLFDCFLLRPRLRQSTGCHTCRDTPVFSRAFAMSCAVESARRFDGTYRGSSFFHGEGIRILL